MEPTRQLEAILPSITELVDQLEPADLGNPTPCEKFEVVDVLDHMITLGGVLAYMFRGEVVPEIEPPVRNGAVPTAEFRKSMDDLLDAVRIDGALERVIDSPFGTMPGGMFARFVAFDGLVHG
ncbi:MAG: maleylpyruvate isomerase N-terminal domain-containing protein, partial [Microthrixaceae bacterium]